MVRLFWKFKFIVSYTMSVFALKLIKTAYLMLRSWELKIQFLSISFDPKYSSPISGVQRAWEPLLTSLEESTLGRGKPFIKQHATDKIQLSCTVCLTDVAIQQETRWSISFLHYAWQLYMLLKLRLLWCVGLAVSWSLSWFYDLPN